MGVAKGLVAMGRLFEHKKNCPSSLWTWLVPAVLCSSMVVAVGTAHPISDMWPSSRYLINEGVNDLRSSSHRYMISLISTGPAPVDLSLDAISRMASSHGHRFYFMRSGRDHIPYHFMPLIQEGRGTVLVHDRNGHLVYRSSFQSQDDIIKAIRSLS